jgi:hypothetical protein
MMIFRKGYLCFRSVIDVSLEVLDISAWTVAASETIGDDEKVWLRDPADVRWLFKPVVVHAGWRQGEDWAERISCEIARAFGIPAATVELAVRDDRPGCISKNVIPSNWELQPGAVPLSGMVDGYESRAKLRIGHNLSNIERILIDCQLPPDSDLPFQGAFNLFAGYLVFDALIANCDRHDENWALLRDLVTDQPPSLAPSYDHANSLGFNLQDAARARLVSEGKVADWAGKGRAMRFEHRSNEVPTLVQLAKDALTRTDADVRDYWHERVAQLGADSWESLVEEVPVLSVPSRTFVLELLRANRRRVLDGCW